jgi:hypothetical protein
MTLMLIVVMKSHEGQKLYALGPITSKNGTKKIFLVAFVCLRKQLKEEIEEAISYQTNR